MDPARLQKVIAVAVITDADGRILLQQRKDPSVPEADGKWELPGGSVEFGELPADTARRETIEETGCVVDIVRLIPFIWSRLWTRADGSEYHAVVIGYHARYVSGTPRATDPKVSQVSWFAPAEVSSLELLSGTPEFIAAFSLKE